MCNLTCSPLCKCLFDIANVAGPDTVLPDTPKGKVMTLGTTHALTPHALVARIRWSGPSLTTCFGTELVRKSRRGKALKIWSMCLHLAPGVEKKWLVQLSRRRLDITSDIGYVEDDILTYEFDELTNSQVAMIVAYGFHRSEEVHQIPIRVL